MVTNAKPKTGGSVHVAPLGTTLPTDATTALAAAFESLGYISEDGITNSTTRESASIKEWGGSTVLNPQTEFEATYKMTFLDSVDLNVLKAVFGSANVTGTLATGITVKVNADELDEQSWAIDMVLNGGAVERDIIPSGKITEVGDIQYVADDAVMFEVTITTHPDSSGNNAYKYLYKA
jgi:hypothetical protein